jgi:hypothetical protein
VRRDEFGLPGGSNRSAGVALNCSVSLASSRLASKRHRPLRAQVFATTGEDVLVTLGAQDGRHRGHAAQFCAGYQRR